MSDTSSTSGAPASSVTTDKTSVLSKAFRHIDLDGHDLPPSPAPSSPRNGRRYALATELVYTESNDQHNASSVPIYQVSSLAATSHSITDSFCSPRLLNKRQAEVAASMIIQDREILLGRI